MTQVFATLAVWLFLIFAAIGVVLSFQWLWKVIQKLRRM